MKLGLRIVTEIPLKEIWNEDGFASSERLGDLSAKDIRELLRKGPVEFVAADVGEPLRWIPVKTRHEFWKTEVRKHLADPDSKISLDDFPNGYCYSASEWKSQGREAVVVVMEKQH